MPRISSSCCSIAVEEDGAPFICNWFGCNKETRIMLRSIPIYSKETPIYMRAICQQHLEEYKLWRCDHEGAE